MGSIVVASMFRDSEGYLDRYFNQVYALEETGDLDVQLVVAEGDSDDGTYETLQKYARRDDVVLKVDHHGPRWPSIDHSMRWAQLAYVCNSIMDAVPPGLPVIYVESDLIWSAETMLALLAHLTRVPAVAPMCFKGDRFYDTWGHRGLDGERFAPYPPYHQDINGFTQIGSAGSCVAMRPEVAEKVRFGDDDCIVGLGRSIRDLGFSLWLDPELRVMHP